MIHTPKHLIFALRNVLLKLEATVPPDTGQVSFAELKHILRQRIAELERCAPSLPIVLPLPKSE